jgi:hypothetical protein
MKTASEIIAHTIKRLSEVTEVKDWHVVRTNSMEDIKLLDPVSRTLIPTLVRIS